MSEDEEWLRMGVAAEMAKIDASDAQTMVRSSLELIEKMCPGRVSVRTQGLFKKVTTGFSVMMERSQLNLDIQNGFVRPSRTMVSAGIALKTEPISIEEWTNQFISELEAEAARNANAKSALQKFLGL